MSNLILTETPDANDTNLDSETGTNIETVLLSTMKKRFSHTQGKVPCLFDSSLTQASAVSEEATDAPNNDREEDRGRKEDSRIDRTSGSDGTTDKSILHNKNPTGSEYGAEAKACIALSMGCDIIKVGNNANTSSFLSWQKEIQLILTSLISSME